LNNKSIDFARTWKENGLSYSETIRQEYGGNNCVISAGFVEGHDKPEVDIIYVRLEKDGVEPTTLLLRPDEAGPRVGIIGCGVVALDATSRDKRGG